MHDRRARYRPAVHTPPTNPANGGLKPQPLRIKPRPAIVYAIKQHANDQIERIRRIRGRGTGKLLAIIGNGPSITEIDLSLLAGYPDRLHVMSINRPDDRIWPTDLWAFCDISQYHRHYDRWTQYTGTLINSSAIPHQRPGSVHVRSLQGFGFSVDLQQGFYVGRSTVYANMQTALWMGYEHIYLFGVDMNPKGLNGQLWFYGVNPDAPRQSREKRFLLEAAHYKWAAEHLDGTVRARFTFCSAHNPHNFTAAFGDGRMDHTEAIRTVLHRL